MGTIIRVKSADFSNGPLGRVTSEDAMVAQIVSNYVEAIGDSTYQNELTVMVKSLLQNDLLNGIDIYPMLGDTLDKKLVNLNPERGNMKWNLSTGAQASSVDNYINFNQTIATGSFDFEIAFEVVMENFYIIADMQRIATSPNTSPLYSPFSGYMCNLGGKHFSDGVGRTSFYTNFNDNNLSVSNTTRRLISGSMFTKSGANVGTNDVYSDCEKVGERDMSIAITTITTYNPGITNIIGGKNDTSDTTNIFDGKCWFFAYGFVDHSKRELADSIFKTFLDAVKPRN